MYTPGWEGLIPHAFTPAETIPYWINLIPFRFDGKTRGLPESPKRIFIYEITNENTVTRRTYRHTRR